MGKIIICADIAALIGENPGVTRSFIIDHYREEDDERLQYEISSDNTHIHEWIRAKIDGKLDTSQIMYNKNITDTDWIIIGKVDGIIHSNGFSYAIEIKHRQKGLLTSIPKHEQIKAQMYMYISGLRSTKIVQHYNGQYSILDMDYDEECIEFYLSELKKSIREISTPE